MIKKPARPARKSPATSRVKAGKKNLKTLHMDTRAIHAGRHPTLHSGMVNAPVYRASTIVFPTIEDYEAAQHGHPFYPNTEGVQSRDFSYGTTGTPTTYSLQRAIAELEGGENTLLFPSGLSAITTTLLSFLDAGDHVLMVDSVYGPTRRFCNKQLRRLGIETTYYDPMIGADIAKLVRKNTRLVFTESPGSLTFEIQDIPAISAAVKSIRKEIVVAIDNSWATPLYFKPFEKGVDVSIHAGTKYINGHADVLIGSVTANGEHFEAIYNTFHHFGNCASPDDCYLAARGLRTLPARLKQHEQSALALAGWLKEHPRVNRVLHPALEDCPGHTTWKRDFHGSTGLFSVVLDKAYPDKTMAKMLNSMELFSIGASWGGFESLLLPIKPATHRTATEWKEKRSCIRIHAGLEHVGDLMKDLEISLSKLK